MKFSRMFSHAKFIKQVKDKAQDDDLDIQSAVKEVAKDIMVGYLIYYGFWMLIVIAGLAALSFSHVLGGPYVIAQILLFLVIGTLVIAGGGLWFLYHKAREGFDEFKNKYGSNSFNPDFHKEVDEHVREAEVVDEDDK